MGKSSGGVRNTANIVEKGTDAYRVAQNYASRLEGSTDTFNLGTPFSKSQDSGLMADARKYVEAVSKTKGFGAEVAKTVLSRSGADPYNIARMSDKQAWAIARTGVENGISYGNNRRLNVKKEAAVIRQRQAELNQRLRAGRKKYYDALKKWSERKKQRNNK